MAETLGIGLYAPARVLAAGAFALSPRVLTTLGSISSETLPVMLAPWVLLPVIRAMRGDSSLRVLAARAGGNGVDGGRQRGGHADRCLPALDLVGLPSARPRVGPVQRMVVVSRRWP